MDNHLEPPTTIKEIGIHLVYMSKKLEELDNTLKAQNAIYATKDDISSIKVRVTSLEDNTVSRKEVFAIVGAVGLAGTILAIVANVMKLFGG